LSNEDTNTEQKLFHNFGGHCKWGVIFWMKVQKIQ
jgi:hypothetical protein